MTPEQDDATRAIMVKALKPEFRPGTQVIVDGVVVGTVERVRHTVRTPYAYTRIGYDRTHWCWVAHPAHIPGQDLQGFFDRRSSWCHRTKAEAIAAVKP